MEELGRRYYLLALSAAVRGDLSSAARMAGLACKLDGAPDKACRLLGICLFELGDTENAVNILAEFPDLAEAAKKAHENMQASLNEIKQLVSRDKWRAALKAAENIPHQSVRLLEIQGCILAVKKRYASAGRLFSLAMEKDTGNRAAQEHLKATAQSVKYFYGAW